MTFMGLPTTTEKAGTSLHITQPALITAPLPILTPDMIKTLVPIQTPSLIIMGPFVLAVSSSLSNK